MFVIVFFGNRKHIVFRIHQCLCRIIRHHIGGHGIGGLYISGNIIERISGLYKHIGTTHTHNHTCKEKNYTKRTPDIASGLFLSLFLFTKIKQTIFYNEQQQQT